MKYLAALDLFNISNNKNFSGMTYADFLMKLIKTDKQSQLKQQLARYLNLEINSDFIHKIEWLGMLNSEPIKLQHGSNGDILVELMTKKLFYGPSERDMVILYAEVIAEFTSYKEKRVCSLLLEGEPDGDSAMSRSVSLPAAIAAKLIVENKIDLKGVWRPTNKAIYQPVLEEMEGFGYQFVVSSSRDYE